GDLAPTPRCRKDWPGAGPAGPIGAIPTRRGDRLGGRRLPRCGDLAGDARTTGPTEGTCIDTAGRGSDPAARRNPRDINQETPSMYTRWGIPYHAVFGQSDADRYDPCCRAFLRPEP